MSPAAPKAAAESEEMVSLKLPDADIDTVLSTLEIYTGKIILRPAQLPTAPGGYNLKIAKPIPKSEAILFIETILAMNQIAVIPMGEDALKIVALPQARTEAPEMITGSTLGLPPSSKVASKFFQLDFLRVTEFAQMMGMISNPNISPQPVQFPNANAILVTDTISNLQRIERLLQEVDKPLMQGITPKFYPVHHAKASDLVAKIRAMLSVGTLPQQIGTGTSYSADDRTNQVILITDPRQYPFFDELIAKLDIESDPNTRNDVIYLKHAKASEVVTVLSNIISKQTQATQRSQSVRPGTPMPQGPMPGQPGGPPNRPGPVLVSASGAGNPNTDEAGADQFSSLVTIANDDRSNSIIVSGTLDDIRMVKELVDKLDIVLAQVRIEVVIAEVTLDDNHQSGIDTLGLKLDGDRLVGFSATSVKGSAFTIGGGTDGTGYASISRIGGPGSLGRSLDLTSIITLGTTPRKSNTTILTVPAIVTTHGKEAVITDGETRPVITGSTVYPGATTGATTSSQVTQQKIGTTLTVTPYIGNDGTVNLDIQTVLTDVTGEVTVDGNTQYIIGDRETKSNITAKSGEIIVMGGFRKEIDSKSNSRLGPIPIIGDLFGSRKKEKYHQELIFFMRPTVLANNPAIDNAETMNRVNELPTRDQIKGTLDPKYQAPKRSIIDKILPK